MPVLLIKFLPYIIGAVLIVSGYFGWKHHIETAVRDEVLAEVAARDAETERKGKELLKLKQHEADLINQRNQARANNAIEIYAQRYDDLRRAASAEPVRMRVKASKTSCDTNTMPGTDESRHAPGGGSARVAEAELSPSAAREFNKVIDRIEEMQLKCERLLNTVAD